MKKDELLRIRVTQEQKTLFQDVAERSGLTLSSWIVAAGLEKAREAR